jgi:hypothetical protein
MTSVLIIGMDSPVVDKEMKSHKSRKSRKVKSSVPAQKSSITASSKNDVFQHYKQLAKEKIARVRDC